MESHWRALSRIFVWLDSCFKTITGCCKMEKWETSQEPMPLLQQRWWQLEPRCLQIHRLREHKINRGDKNNSIVLSSSHWKLRVATEWDDALRQRAQRDEENEVAPRTHSLEEERWTRKKRQWKQVPFLRCWLYTRHWTKYSTAMASFRLHDDLMWLTQLDLFYRWRNWSPAECSDFPKI